MKIKTLADILAEEYLVIHGEDKSNTKESLSPYFEDDPAFQEFTDVKTTNKSSNKDSFMSNTRFKKSVATKKDTKKNGTKKNRTTKRYVKKIAVKKSTLTKARKTNELHDVKIDYKSDSSSNTKPKPIDNLTEKLPTLLPELLKTGLKTPEQRQAEKDEIKAERRLRWLAFYYLSTREHSAQELKDKLLAKEQEPKKIDALLKEFEEKGYQSDMRTALMLIREGIRKGRGRRRIKQDFYKRKVAVPSNIDELIDMANEESAEFVDFVDNETVSATNGKEHVNWLKLAVDARVKKYGEEIPTEPKEKAKQLRFLQYRGFNTNVCFEALQHDLESVEAVF